MLKFLVIRFSSIGDIVLTTPVVRLLKSKFPDSEVHFLTKQKFSFLLSENPNIDKVISYDKNLKTVLKIIKNENYDHLIDLHNNLRTRRIKNALSIPDFTIDKLNIQKWLLVNFKINKLPKNHIVDRYIDTLSVFDITNDNKPLDYIIPEKDIFKLAENNKILKKPFISFVLGATYFTKQVPKELAIDIMNKSGLTFILLGGKEDIDKSVEIEKNLKIPFLNLCGKINLNQSASVISQSKLVVSSDTGLMHIASAFKKPIISLWGNTVPEFGMSPYQPHKDSRIFEYKELKCRPCSKIGFEKCPKKHFKCMLQLDTNEISNYIKKIYKN